MALDEDELSYDENATCKDRLIDWYFDKVDIVAWLQAICILFLIVMAWGIAYSIYGNKVGIYSDAFAILTLFVTSKAFGILVGWVKIPPTIGMIIMGIILKNVGFLEVSKDSLIVTAYIRKLTLLSVLLPAAFSLQLAILKQMFCVIISVAIFPSLIEIVVVMVLAKFCLFLPWLWSILLGIIMAASAPAIIIPCLFALEAKGYPDINGVYTLTTAACILNVIESVTIFGLVFGFITMKSDNFVNTLIKGPIEIVIGVAYGLIFGFIAEFIPHDLDWYVVPLRTAFICFGSLLIFFGSQAVDYSGAGVLGCFCLAFVANLRWRKQGWTMHNPCQENFKVIWQFFEPISFSLIGMEINFKTIVLSDMLIGSFVFTVGLLAHFFVGILMLKQFKFSWKNAVFISIAYISKATVQAALGPLTVDYAREVENESISQYAATVVTVTAISIIITSPLGTVLLLVLGPKLLKKSEVSPEESFKKSRIALLTIPDYALRHETRRVIIPRHNRPSMLTPRRLSPDLQSIAGRK